LYLCSVYDLWILSLLRGKSMKKICVVTLNIEFDDTHTNPKDWSWEPLVNAPLINMSEKDLDRYYCPTILVDCKYFETK